MKNSRKNFLGTENFFCLERIRTKLSSLLSSLHNEDAYKASLSLDVRMVS